MQEIFNIFQEYNGIGYYTIIYVIAVLYLWFNEDNRATRVIIIYSGIVIMVLFASPLFYDLYYILDRGTYYRILWTLPMTIVIAYAGVKLISKKSSIGIVVLVLVVMFSGRNVYKNEYMLPSENLYQLPQDVIDICDIIAPKEEEEWVWAVFPKDLLHFVRQYTSRINMPYGRELIVESWKSIPHPLYDLMTSEKVDVNDLSRLATEYRCNYVILNEDTKLRGSMEYYDFHKIEQVGSYVIYLNKLTPFYVNGEPIMPEDMNMY